MFNIQVIRKGNRFSLDGQNLPTNIVEWWNLDELSGNRAGSINGLTLTDQNSVGNAAGANSSVAARYVSASSQNLLRTNEAALQLGDIDFSFVGWIYIEAYSYISIVNKWGDGGESEYLLYYDPVSTVFRLLLNAGAGNLPASTFGAPAFDTWNMVYADYDAANDLMRISVNGGAFNTGSLAGGAPVTTCPFSIGKVDTSNFPNGRVQRVGFWKRKLTDAEISYLYNSGNGRSYPF